MDPANFWVSYTNYAHSRPGYQTPSPSFYHSVPHVDDYTFGGDFFNLATGDNTQVPTPKVGLPIVIVDFLFSLTIIVALAFSLAISGKPNMDNGCSLDLLRRRHDPPFLDHFDGIPPKYSPAT